jgi:hypothetical protein
VSTRLTNELVCACGASGRVLWSEGGHRDCVERVVEIRGEFKHRQVAVPFGDGETFELSCRRCGRSVELGAPVPDRASASAAVVPAPP